MLVDHICEGPSALFPPGTRVNDIPWLESFVFLKRQRGYQGAVEVRQVYELPNVIKGLQGYDPEEYAYPIVRRVVWDRDRDNNRRQPKWPSIQADLYRVQPSQFARLHKLVLALDGALSSFPFEADGIRKGSRVSKRPRWFAVDAAAISHQLTVRRSTRSTTVELSDWALPDDSFTKQFMRLWEFMDELHTSRNRAPKGWRQKWDIPPRKYAAALDVAFPGPARRD